jgi:predicted dehydrogenase
MPNEKETGGNPVPASKQIRLGLIGCGEATQIIHWPTLGRLPELYQVTALCDVSPRVLEGLGARWNIRSLSTDPREIVDREDVDAVLVATPNAFHAEVTMWAIQAGKHALVEKPMCITQREAREIIAAQKTSRSIVQVGYMRRYAPAFLEARQQLNEIGEIKLGRVRDILGHNNLIIDQTSEVLRDKQLPAKLIREAKDRETALVEEAIGNTPEILQKAYKLMLGLSSHDLSAMRELLGRPARTLFAAQRGSLPYLAAVFDYGSYVCQFETGIDNIPRFDGHLEVYGDKKVLRVEYDTPYVRNLPVRLYLTESNGQGGVRQTAVHPAWGDPFVEQWKAFYLSVTQNRQPKTDPTDFVEDLQLFSEIMALLKV